MAKKAIDRLHKIIGGKLGGLGDGSGTFITIQNDTHVIEFSFDGKGNVIEDISVWKRVWVEDCATPVTKFKK